MYFCLPLPMYFCLPSGVYFYLPLGVYFSLPFPQVDEHRAVLLVNTGSYGPGIRSLVIISIDSTNGNDLWKYAYGGEGEEQIWKGSNMYVYQDQVDNKMYAVVACSTTSFGDDKDFWILRIDMDTGSIRDQHRIGGDGIETLHSITPTQDGGCFVVGNTTQSFGNTNTFIWALELGSDFKTIKWEYAYGRDGEGLYYGGRSGFQAENRGFVIGGITNDGMGESDFVVLKVSEYGELVHACGLNMTRTNARIQETNTIPLIIDIPSETDIPGIGPETRYVNLSSEAKSIKICGLPHAPENLNLETKTNRTLTRGERVNILSWKNSSLNVPDEVEKFRVYWKFADESDAKFKWLADVPFFETVSDNMYEYVHEQLILNENYTYAVAAVAVVDSKKVEGPWTTPVENEY